MSQSTPEPGVFFILGCQKSGTTWLPALLGAHPHIACSGEGHFTDTLAPMLEIAINEYNRLQTEQHRLDQSLLLTTDDLFDAVRVFIDATLRKYIARCPQPAAIRMVGDKTPEHALSIPQIHRLYPDARFIHIIRDGRDGAVSGWAHIQRSGGDDQLKTFGAYAQYFAQSHWTPYIRQARAAGAHIPDQYMELRYEELKADTEGQTRRMLQFLGVDDADHLVRACADAGSFTKMSGGRTAGSEDHSSHFRKGVVGDWVNHFDDAALAGFEEHAGELLAELGYATSTALASASNDLRR